MNSFVGIECACACAYHACFLSGYAPRSYVSRAPRYPPAQQAYEVPMTRSYGYAAPVSYGAPAYAAPVSYGAPSYGASPAVPYAAASYAPEVGYGGGYGGGYGYGAPSGYGRMPGRPRSMPGGWE